MVTNDKIDFRVPAEMAKAAEQGLKWHDQFGRGGTEVGVERAKQLMGRPELSPEDVRHIYSYFARHEVDKQGKDFDNDENPSAGRIAWELWGGEAGKAWVTKIHDQMAEAEK